MSLLAEPEVQHEPTVGQVSEPGGSKISFVDVWRTLLKRRWMILAVTLLVFVGTTWYTYRIKPIYQSVARIEISPTSQNNIGLQEVVNEARGGGSDSSALSTELQILQSNSVLLDTAQKLIEQGRIPAPPVDPHPTEYSTTAQRVNLIGYVRSGLHVAQVPTTHLVDITYRSTDPQLAKDLVNDLVDSYISSDLQSRLDRTGYVSNFLQTALAGLKKDAQDAQRRLAEFQKQNNIVGSDDNSTNLTIQGLQSISQSLQQAETDRILKEARLRDYESQTPAMASLLGDDPLLASLRGQEADLKAQYAQLSARYGAHYPKMEDLQTQINRLDERIKAELKISRDQIEQEYLGALHSEQTLRKRLGEQEEAAYKLNEGAAQYAILRHEAELNRDLYDTLQVRLKEASVTAGLNANNITRVDTAMLPLYPVAPKKEQNILFGFLGGLVAGIILAFIMEAIDDTLPTSEEVESVLALPSLATIPHMTRDAQKGRRERAGESRMQQLELLNNPQSVAAEGYRGLRSALMLSSVDRPPRVIVVTSAFASEGKTTTTVNCAVSFAQRGERVLLVDADLRKGRIGHFFNMDKEAFGLTSLLAQSAASQPFAAPIAELPTLHVLPTGPRPPNPSEVLASNRMEEQLKIWMQEYDRIIIDTAPLLPVSDTQALAAIADTVILVARAGATRKRALVRARDVLHRIHAPITGVVVNDVDLRLENFYTYRYGMYGYGAYGYQYGDQDSASTNGNGKKKEQSR